MLKFVKRVWVPLLVVVAVVLGGVAVVQLRRVFGSEKIFSATESSAKPLTPSHVKRVTYEVYGPSDTTGTVSYLNKDAQPEQANFTSLPWIYTLSTTIPAVIANVVAQGNSDNIRCRITVNGEVKDEQSSAGRHAQTSCLVKAA
ncbi:transport acessory protein MmpS [Mycobacterium heckeshornense]|uniref:Putative membrane protein, MmpS n=1 Tax=Mycobacterium heckeshornense TaxID=110505 RepID=A0A2G8AVF8_9MYCO|nr:MmpS family transport accessory protein [Mycobacterium heckeshornense]KMV16326.1 membrane protein [Mycobacterium heckeshornense]MCV7035169.1 transport acessory protein MmpS [Mycobacterium heckeshornense]PIJ29518.1 transport acessory protein MmpS [Mycobacterium heckeshornense]BCO34907.1 putative membrane protein, MmpS [Mycobacterium heckeshornense]